MIKVTAKSHGCNFSIHISGHSYYEKKNDIVCSAVSILYYTLLDTVSRDRKVKSSSVKEKSGDAFIVFTGGKMAAQAYRTVICGLKLLAENYPENIKINYRKGLI